MLISFFNLLYKPTHVILKIDSYLLVDQIGQIARSLVLIMREGVD